MDALPVAPRAMVPPQALPRAAMPGPHTVQPNFQSSPAVTKEDMQRALDAVRARRGTPTLQEKPSEREAPLMPVLEASDLEDVLEDEEAMVPAVKREGFGVPGDSCPKMGGLVQRRA
jgi:hypothetical protein